MGSFLNFVAQPALRVRLGLFRFALLYPTVYMFLFFTLFGTTKPALLALIFPLHFFAMFCMFYSIYFVSRNLALVEKGKQVSLPDYAGAFFLLWFFPIGVWFIQPKINRLYAQPFSGQKSMRPVELPNPLNAPTADTRGDAAATQSATPLAYAGFWLRLLAALIDGFVITFPLFLFAFCATFVVRLVSAGRGYDPAVGIFAVLTAVTLVIPLFYFSILESSPWQATVGKSVLRLYVTDLEGRRLTRGRATGRNLAKLLSNLTVGLGHLMCGFTEKKQALHDALAGCLVLRRPKY